MFKAMPRARLLRAVTAAVASVAVVSALAFAGAGQAAFERTVQVVGCSNSLRIEQAYTFASDRDVTVNSARGGASLSLWAQEGSEVWTGSARVSGFDANLAAHGATMIWYPLCIKGGEYSSGASAYKAFQRFVGLLRKRTSAPLYVSAKIGEQPTCGNAQAQQAYVVNRAVAEGLALRGDDIPPASVPDEDNCHFDTALSTNVQEAAVAFLDA